MNEITSQSGATSRTLSYDANGSLTSDGGTRTFEWDGANRLVAVNYTGTTQRSEFSYDGLNRCVKLVEKTGNTVNSTRKFVLCGTEKCEYRNATGAVQLQLFSQGQYQGTGASFYTRDHLGSLREMTDGSGTVVARYDYDPWGRSTPVIGTNKPDFNFTGLYNHVKSGLDMAVYRAYDPDLGRWLSRDPIAEAGGLNLYGYVSGNPARLVDLLGLEVAATLNLSGGVFTATDTTTGSGVSGTVTSGNGNVGDVAISNLGPIPPGVYNIYPRPSRFGLTPEYIVDPVDARPGNDRWDSGTGRGSFRIHLAFPDMPNRGSQGCVVGDLDFLERLRSLFDATDLGPSALVVSGNGGAPPDIWLAARLGLLTVTP